MKLLDSVIDFNIEEAKLMLKINDAIYKILLDKDTSLNVSSLELRYRLYERSISYLVGEFGVVLAYNSKGHYCNLTDLPMSDLQILVKHLDL